MGPQALRHGGRQSGPRQGRRVLPGVILRARVVHEHRDTVGSRVRQRSRVQPAQHRVPRRRRREGGRLRPVDLRQDRLSLSEERVRVGRISLGQASAAERNADGCEHSARARPYVRPPARTGVVVRSPALRRRELRRPLRHDGQRHRRLRLLREMAARMDHAGDTRIAGRPSTRSPPSRPRRPSPRASSSRRHATATGSKSVATRPATRPALC